MKTDFENIKEGQIVLAFPDLGKNRLWKKPHLLIRQKGYFFPTEKEECFEPDYTIRNIKIYCLGYEEVK